MIQKLLHYLCMQVSKLLVILHAHTVEKETLAGKKFGEFGQKFDSPMFYMYVYHN